MRTVIALGLLMIGGALRTLAEMPPIGYEAFFIVVIIASIAMDLIEFFNNINKN